MNNIVLIGFMGSGKSTVGKMLSEVLNRDFMDMDDEIERNEETTIKEIFADKGEAYFRDIETSYLSKMITKEDTIISTGGGIIVREENLDIMKKLGRVIFLHSDSEQLINNLKGDQSRPLLKGDNPEKKINELLAARESKYINASDIIIQTTGKDVKSVVEEIISLL